MQEVQACDEMQTANKIRLVQYVAKERNPFTTLPSVDQ
jgi:hypothetical protein